MKEPKKPVNRKTLLLKYGITTLVGGLMAYAVIAGNRVSLHASDADRWRVLTDAFSIPGILFIMFGLLVWISGEGMFEGLSYVATYAIKMLIPGAAYRHEKYADYVERKREKGAIHGYGFLFVTGLVFLVVAGVFMVLFYTVYQR